MWENPHGLPKKEIIWKPYLILLYLKGMWMPVALGMSFDQRNKLRYV